MAWFSNLCWFRLKLIGKRVQLALKFKQFVGSRVHGSSMSGVSP
ncbi:MAG: hypothetical protein ACYDBJ_11140 [Aggregatilineales bacterium]